jgi:hypothetical protein
MRTDATQFQSRLAIVKSQSAGATGEVFAGQQPLNMLRQERSLLGEV